MSFRKNQNLEKEQSNEDFQEVVEQDDYNNQKVLEDIQEGLLQSKEGKLISRGSFAKYAEDAL